VAIAAPDPQQDPERWRRFTLLDLFLIQLGVAIGFSLAAALRPPVYADWPFVVIAGAILGPVFCGPIVLFVQWFFRRRNERLSAGEWLWLSPLLIHLSAIALMTALAQSNDPFLVLVLIAIAVVWLLAQLICAVLAGLMLLSVLVRTRPPGPCVWTDCGGAVVGLLSNLLVCPGLLLLLLAA
jgi:hypothetical protein